MKEPIHHPVVLSKNDVFAIIDAVANLKIKAAIAVLYSSGLRVEECSLLLKRSNEEKSFMSAALLQGRDEESQLTVLTYQH